MYCYTCNEDRYTVEAKCDNSPWTVTLCAVCGRIMQYKNENYRSKKRED